MSSSQLSPSLNPPTNMTPLSSSPPRSADTGSSSDPTSRSSPRAPSPLNPHRHSQSPTPPSRASLLPTPPPTARGRQRSFGGRDLSPARDAAKTTQSVIPMARVASAPAAPQSTAGESTYLPVSAPAASAPGLFQFGSRSRSVATSPERGGHETDGNDSIAPSSTWWGLSIHSPRPWAENSKRKRSIPVEQAEGYAHTRSVRPFLAITFLVLLIRKPLQRVIEAIGGVLGTAASIGHEVLFTGVDLLPFAPVPGLQLVASVLLNIWDALDRVEVSLMGKPFAAPLLLTADLFR